MADEDKLEQETFEIAELYQEQTESSYNQALKRIGKNKDLAKIIHPEVGTLLHLACKYNLLSHVKVLVKNDADVNAHGGKLKNKPLHEALFNPNKVKRKVSRRSQHNESFEIVKHLLDNGAEVNAVNKYSTTPLHSCCIEGLADCAKLLLDKNADFTLKAGKAAKESTPLHFAAEYGWASVAKLLLDRGADHLVENSEGKTPYQVAVESTLIFDEAMRKAVCNVFDKDLNQVVDRKKFYHESVLENKTPTQELDRYDKFLVWLKENNAFFPDQYLKKYSEDVRGVHAEKDIPADKQIATVPLKLLIHEGMGQETEYGKRVHNTENNIIVPNHTQVIIYLLSTGARYWAKPNGKCTSFFKPYYDILPRNFYSFPIFWNEEELSWLEGSTLVQQIHDRKNNILYDYHEVCRVCPEFREDFNEEDFLWCRTAVGSRNFGISINGVKRTTLVPWSDMLNHYRPRETSWTFSDAQQSFIMTSLKKLEKGQQIMDSYGKKCNSKFLMHYGFAVENNRESDGRCMNEIAIHVELPSTEIDDFLSEQRVQILTTSELVTRASMTYDDQGSAELLSFCRVAVANQTELDIIFQRGHMHYPITENPIEPISARNEVAAFAYLARTCRRRLLLYPTTIEEDTDMLENANIEPFSNRRCALILVKGEKDILHYYIEIAEMLVSLLQKKLTDVERIVHREYSNDRKDIDRYLMYLIKKLLRVDMEDSDY